MIDNGYMDNNESPKVCTYCGRVDPLYLDALELSLGVVVCAGWCAIALDEDSKE